MAKKDTDTLFLQTVRKYAPALCLCLYPSQTKDLKTALNDYQLGYEPYIKDPFVNLAYSMIVADYEWERDFVSGNISV